MIPWTPFERRWRDVAVAAVLPGPAPAPDFWTELATAATPLLRFGLRAAVWLLTFAPLLHGRPHLLGGLPEADREALLARLGAHRLFLVRQVVTTVKLIAAFGVFREPPARRAITG